MAEPSSTPEIQASKKNRSIEKKAIDDAFKLNMFFVIAVAFAISDGCVGQILSSENRLECSAGHEAARKLASLEVTSYTLFIIAMSISAFQKLHSISRNIMASFSDDDSRFEEGHSSVATGVWERVWFDASRAASVAGVLFLTVASAYAVQIWIGLRSCGSHDALSALSHHAIRAAAGFLYGYLHCYILAPLLVKWIT